MQNRIRNMSSVEWNTSRPDVASGVLGYQLLPSGLMSHSISLTRVKPEGKFAAHTDDYHHILYFIEGTGAGMIGERQYKIEPGMIVEVESGTIHSYENTGATDMLLLTINLR